MQHSSTYAKNLLIELVCQIAKLSNFSLLAQPALARETRVGSPLDFQLKRVSAPNCLRALNRSAQAGRRARADEITQLNAAKSPQERALPKQAAYNATAPT